MGFVGQAFHHHSLPVGQELGSPGATLYFD